MSFLKELLLWILLLLVGMFNVFMGMLLGYGAMYAASFIGNRYVFARVSKWIAFVFRDAAWDEKKGWLAGVLLVLLLFGILFAHFSASSVKKGRYILRGLLSCLILGMTTGVCRSAFELSLYPEETQHWEVGEQELFISLIGGSIMLYYLMRREGARS